jgi:Tol biopolymer transport system component
MLAWGTGGTFVIGVNGMKQIASAGTPVATGPLTFVFRECTGGRCSLVSIDRTSGRRQTIGPAPERDAEAPIGLVSPDGQRVALVEGVAGSTELHLIDLRTGDDEAVGSVEGWSSLTPTAAWSADGRWLVYVDPDNGLVARQPALARTVTVDATIHPRVVQLRRTPAATTAP